jgi:hypothetical protein
LGLKPASTDSKLNYKEMKNTGPDKLPGRQSILKFVKVVWSFEKEGWTET